MNAAIIIVFLLNGMQVALPAPAWMTGSRAAWEEASQTVNLIAGDQAKTPATEIGAIIADPPQWAGKQVRLHGEYTGRQVDPFDPATTPGPPVTPNDWTVRDATGSLYCTPAAGAPELPVKLDPTNDLGRRLEVVGTVALTAGGQPYLQVEGMTLLTGLAGITCYLTTDKDTYQPGDTMQMQMQVRNPMQAAVALNFPTSQHYDFTVTDPEGKAVWKWSQGRMFAQMLTQKTLQPGDAYTVTAQWALPATLPPAHYKVSGLLNRDVQSYVKTVAVGKE